MGSRRKGIYEKKVTNCVAFGPEVEVKARTPSLAGPEVERMFLSLSLSLLPLSLNKELRVKSRVGRRPLSHCAGGTHRNRRQ